MCHLALILADLLDWGTPCNSSTKFPEWKHSALQIIVTTQHDKGLSSYLWDSLVGGQILQRRSVFSGKCDGWSSDDFLALGANRGTVRTVRMWWPGVGQVPGGRKHRADISHNLSDSCSWVFCEISAVRQESQKKLEGRKGSRKTQEVSASYSWMNSPWAPGEVSEWRWFSLHWVTSELRKTMQQEHEQQENIQFPQTALSVPVGKVYFACYPALGR